MLSANVFTRSEPLMARPSSRSLSFRRGSWGRRRAALTASFQVRNQRITIWTEIPEYERNSERVGARPSCLARAITELRIWRLSGMGDTAYLGSGCADCLVCVLDHSRFHFGVRLPWSATLGCTWRCKCPRAFPGLRRELPRNKKSGRRISRGRNAVLSAETIHKGKYMLK